MSGTVFGVGTRYPFNNGKCSTICHVYVYAIDTLNAVRAVGRGVQSGAVD